MKHFDRLQDFLASHRKREAMLTEFRSLVEDADEPFEPAVEVQRDHTAAEPAARFAERLSDTTVLDVRNTPVGFLFSKDITLEERMRRHESYRGTGLRVMPPILPLWIEGNDWFALLEQAEVVREAPDKTPDSDILDIAITTLSFEDLDAGGECHEISAYVSIARSSGEPAGNAVFDCDRAQLGVSVVTKDSVLLALGLLHCRNVQMVERQAPRHERRQAAREGRQPPTKYYVLEIDGILRKTVEESRLRGESAMQALHLCRGHFKTYSPERPLLGKSSGTFWWEPHVRGTKEAGVIVKDYALKTT